MLLRHNDYSQRLEELCRLFEKAFRRAIDPRFLKWRYLDNPTEKILANVEMCEDRLVANYSASPVCFSVNGTVTMTAMSMTTMTDPDFAGKGLFPKLAEELYCEMEMNNYAMIWGFPNSQSHRIFSSKLQWEDVYEIPTMVLRVENAKMSKIETGIRFDDGFLLDYGPVQSIEKLIHVHKDKQYLQWRYRDNPLNQYRNIVIEKADRVSSYCICKQYHQDMDIIDFQTNNADEAKELLGQAISYARTNNLIRINCWAPRHHYMHGLCERLGFVNEAPITYLGLRSFAPHSISTNYSDWFVQMGDSDVY